MPKDFSETMLFTPIEEHRNMEEILAGVYAALKDKGYAPENQIIGYILSGDPTYITSHHDARKLIRQIDRNELLETLLRDYLVSHGIGDDENQSDHDA